jgi:hypothetical protein
MMALVIALFFCCVDGNAVVNMNLAGVGDSSLWIVKGEECTLSDGLASPYFIPKVSGITVEYDSVLSTSFGMLLLFSFVTFFTTYIFYF